MLPHDATTCDLHLSLLLQTPAPAERAMTSEGSDLASLKSWQSAFEYPLATTRQIEKALCADVSSNKDRLRTLVGYVNAM